MKIQKSTTGGIILTNEDGTIRSIIKSNAVYLHQHPRQDGAILVNDRATCQDDQNSITIVAADVTEIDGTPFSGDRDALLVALDGLFSLGGGTGEGVQTVSTWKATYSETTTAFIYKGGLNNTNWQVNRYDRNNGLAKTTATKTSNATVTTLVDAWTGRGTLNYN